MTVNRTNQYRTLSTLQTASDAGAHVPFFRHAADAMNNWHAYVGGYPLLYAWPADASSNTEVISTGSGDEEFMLHLGRVYVDPSYKYLRVYWGARVASTGAYWDVYGSTNLYTGSATSFETAKLSDATSIASGEFTATTWDIKTGLLSIPYRDRENCIYLHLTSWGGISTLCSLTLQPVLS